MEKQRAIDNLKTQIAAVDGLSRLRRDALEFNKWKLDTKLAIAQIFGPNSRHLKDFSNIRYFLPVMGATEQQRQQAHHEALKDAAGLLRSFIDEINDRWVDETLQPKKAPP